MCPCFDHPQIRFQMVLGLPQDNTEAAKAMNYLKSCHDVTVEEVQDYHG